MGHSCIEIQRLPFSSEPGNKLRALFFEIGLLVRFIIGE